MERKKFKWEVELSDDRGTVTKRNVSAYWDPQSVGCNEAVGHAARSAAWMATGKQREFFVVSVRNLD